MARSRRSRITTMAMAGLAVVTIAAGCGSDDDVTVDGTDVADAVESADSVVAEAAEDANEARDELAQVLRDNGADSVAGLVEQVDLSEVLDTEEFTFFAPNDEAFTALTADDMANLLSDPAGIVDTLRNHALGEMVMSSELAGMDEVQTLSDQTLTVTVDGETIMVGEATVVTADVEVADGVIHVVDRLLLP